MARQINVLTDRRIRTLKEPRYYADGNGLYFVIEEGGSKRWAFIFQLRKRRREMGLGSLADTSLAEAREKRDDARNLIRQGIDPIEAREKPADVDAPRRTLRVAAEELIASLRNGWRGKSTESNWKRSLLTHAGKLTDMEVDEITTEDIVEAVQPYWVNQPESGGKLRDRLEKVLDAEKVKGNRTGENPARWRGHLEHLLPKRRKLIRGHHRAIPYTKAPAVLAEVRRRSGMGARALEFTILTVGREDMILGARWKEIDGSLWTIPPERMKEGDEPFVVPLAKPAMRLLASVRPPVVDPEALIFPGTVTGRQLSNNTMDRVLDRAKIDATPHGFRSTFRDWAGDCTDHAREVVEHALAHAVGDETERAYRRGNALQKRRVLMNDWATFLEDGR